MPKIAFSKYHGAGNDFILIDNREGIFPIDDLCLIVHLCDRHKGVGADGILLVEQSKIADYKMRIFNADGSQPTMCGNGMRCLIHFLAIFDPSKDFKIEVAHRIFQCRRQEEKVSVNLGTPQILHWPIELALHMGIVHIYVLNTGVPHAVLFVEDLMEVPLLEWGKEIRYHRAFAPEGVNVNFTMFGSDGSVILRTYERGIEKETFACGTGAAATAWVAWRLHGFKEPLIIKTLKCRQAMCFQESMTFSFPCNSSDEKEIEMLGSAKLVFSGDIEIDV